MCPKSGLLNRFFLDSDSRGIPREISESCGNSRSAGMEKVRENEHHYWYTKFAIWNTTFGFGIPNLDLVYQI